MFDLFANLITLLTTTLFPLFATYKALRSPTPATLAPWLTFYAVLSMLHLLESTILYPLTYLPLYGWFSLAVHLFLLLPAPQGATFVYNTYVQPFLAEHEHDIDEFISAAHERAKTAGLQYLKQAIEYIRVNVLGQAPQPPTPPQGQYQNYAQQLMARFYSTSTTSGPPPPSNDFYSAILSALQTSARPTTRSALATEGDMSSMSASGTLIPPDMSTPEERLTYIRQARDGLRVLMQAYEREEGDLTDEVATEELSKSRSETSFDKIEREEASNRPAAHSNASSGYMPWNWNSWGGAKAATGAAKKDEGDATTEDVEPEARSSGIELNSKSNFD